MNNMKINRRVIIDTLIKNGYYSIQGLNGKEAEAAVLTLVSEKSDSELLSDYFVAFAKDQAEFLYAKKNPQLYSNKTFVSSIVKMLQYHGTIEELMGHFIKF